MSEFDEVTDNLVPGVYQPQLDEDTQKQTAEERAMVQAAAPMLDTLLAFFDEQIAQCSDISSIDVQADDLKVQLLAQRMLADRLYMAKSHLENLKEAHLKG